MDRQAGEWHRDGLRAEDMPELPEIITTRGGHRAWPALVDQGQSAGIRLFDAEADARQAHRQGLAALLRSGLRDKWKYLRKHHGLSREAQLAWTRVEDIAETAERLRHLALRSFLDGAWAVRDPQAFDRLLTTVRRKLLERYGEMAQIADCCLVEWHRLMRWLDSLEQAVPRAVSDIRSQLDDLMYAGFFDDIEAARLRAYPRYLEAVAVRLDALEQDPVRDQQRMEQVAPWWQRYLDHLERAGWYSDALDRYRWLLEEYRVQVFAQKLGTAEKTSPERLRQAWSDVEAESERIA
jgi:ATP-dependent helicase HrpA